MSNPQKAKGDAAEREVAALLSDLLGFTVRRKLGAGRKDDTGDLDGIPGRKPPLPGLLAQCGDCGAVVGLVATRAGVWGALAAHTCEAA